MSGKNEFSAAHVRCASFILEMIDKYAPTICTKETGEDGGTKAKENNSKSA